MIGMPSHSASGVPTGTSRAISCVGVGMIVGVNVGRGVEVGRVVALAVGTGVVVGVGANAEQAASNTLNKLNKRKNFLRILCIHPKDHSPQINTDKRDLIAFLDRFYPCLSVCICG